MRSFFGTDAKRHGPKDGEKHSLRVKKIKGFRHQIQLKNELTNFGVSVEYRPLRWTSSAALFNNLAK
jgi:hypothetical protein